jgi:hypothetical protein
MPGKFCWFAAGGPSYNGMRSKLFPSRRFTVSAITLDASTAEKLTNIKESIRLCDPTGKVLGEFFPAFSMADWEPVTPDITEEELRRRENSQEKRYSTEEVLKHLEPLE